MKGKHAVVIGASLSGLLAARVLSEHFERVTVLERDEMPALGQGRKGVPQGAHAHGLLGRGREILEGFFPGLTQNLVALGATSKDSQQYVRTYVDGAILATAKSDMLGLGVSRPLLEGYIRQRVLAIPQVYLFENCAVSELLHQNHSVNGVRLRHRDNKTHQILETDLVVDCTGRGSQNAQWLERLGFERPEEEKIQMDLCYATAHFERKPNDLDNAVEAVIVGRTRDCPRSAALVSQEGSRWVVSLGGLMGDVPPTDLQGFQQFAASMASDEIRQIAQNNRLLGEITLFKFPASKRYHYQKLKRFPQGFLVFGDALCSFNPSYGQGMTSAALQALVLAGELQSNEANLSKRFFLRASQVVDIPWQMAAGRDLTHPKVKGKRTRQMRMVNAYLDKLSPVAWQDPKVAYAFLKVINLQAPPSSLMSPNIVWQVIKQMLSGSRSVQKSKQNTPKGVMYER
jgi:2-polyprenyl-6-methoxyphenol hydroxylase-like FAD-dependent oxidoreductase